MLRGVTLIFDGKKAYETYNDPGASGCDKAVDLTHAATDAAYLVGALMMMTPASAPVGAALTSVGALGDMGVFGYHFMRYMEKKSGLYLSYRERMRSNEEFKVFESLSESGDKKAPEKEGVQPAPAKDMSDAKYISQYFQGYHSPYSTEAA